MNVFVRLTGFVEMAKEAPLARAGTVTVAGTETTDELLLERVTAALLAGAGPLSVTCR